MTAAAYIEERKHQPKSIVSRGDFCLSMMQICLGIAAEHYMILDIGRGQDGPAPRILASNWVYDAIDLVGLENIAPLARAPATTRLGETPRPLYPSAAAKPGQGLPRDMAAAMERFGHGELYCLRLHAGARRGLALFSAARPGRIRGDLVSAAQFRCSYVLSEMTGKITGAAFSDPLSQRERECLFWVAEGKTTEEVALILGVSHNTTNRYIAHAIRKLSASNRAKAVATAIRGGIL